MNKLAPYTIIILILLLNSCSPARRAARSTVPSATASEYALGYLNRYSTLAVNEMNRTGIPASITLAQGMLESNYGRSRLATEGNNHFGIKCHSNWTGRKIYHDDNRRGECFRAYGSVDESFRDHSDFLVNGSRYSELFSLSKTDYKGWARGLKKAGYATDPKYADLLIRKIEEYRLWAYDTGAPAQAVAVRPARSASVPSPGTVVSAPPATVKTQPAVKDTALVQPVTVQPSVKDPATVPTQTVPARTTEVRVEEEPIKVISLGTGRKVMENNNVEYVIVEEGDTFESLADRYQLLSWEITRYNDLTPGTTLKPGQVIYLQPKRSKAAQGFSVHTVVPGETMYEISQKYAVKLSDLFKMNLMDEGTECRPGQKVRLR